ncbi:TraB/GumN family protein [Ideonella livida]|uniref:TraB/GumN family protein n=1 Tax=Ideonella livida TaxID=2707176 RepID=A0A7C9TPG1_9BURK|nr:TraB/GumN family protein [Ideonella livida]NDY93866.1 TraB/GumN family protein [Ideonella livida]
MSAWRGLRGLGRLLLLLAAACWLPWRAAVAADCPPAPAPLDEAAQRALWRTAPDRGLLYRVDKDGRSSWLFGTLHVARPDWAVPGPQTRAALQAADRVALELDLTDPAVQRALLAVLRTPAGDPLPEALARRLDQAATGQCAGPELRALRPELQLVQLSLLQLRADGLDAAYGIDGFMAGLARGLGKRLVSLESAQQQARLLLQTDPAQRDAQLAEGLDELESGRGRRLGVRLAQAWAQADVDTLESYAQWCDCLDTPARRADMRRLLDDRNPAMAAQIDRMHRGGLRVFAAVGSLHLIGPQGLPALLRARGYTVQRLTPPHNAGEGARPPRPDPAPAAAPSSANQETPS